MAEKAEKARLGLIGDHIAASRAPRLCALAGAMRGLEVAYDLLVPAEAGVGFDELFERCAAGGYRGINVTYPYKERAAARVDVEDPLVRAMGAVNLVRFEPGGGRPRGFNTDYSGFVAAFRATFGAGWPPGAVCQAGAGGVGKAVAFGLAALGADAVRIVDTDRAKARALARALRAARPGFDAAAAASLEEAAEGARGIVNCTPVGMDGHDGTPVPARLLRGGGAAAWAFDAVYTPPATRFLGDAAAAGLRTMSGLELFFHQGADGFELFFGGTVDRVRLRRALDGDGDEDGAAGAG